MPTLYVENVPRDLYEALRARAKRERRSMAAEVIRILEQNVPTAAELASGREVLRPVEEVGSMTSTDPSPSTEELLRESREER